jgi:beta-mannosidase
MTAGIWRDVRVEVYSTRIADLWTEVELSHDHHHARIQAFAKVESTQNLTAHKATFSLSLAGTEIAQEAAAINQDGSVTVKFKVDKPKLWWPNGYGEQTLYQLSVKVTENDTSVHQLSKNIGIRTAEVIQKPDKHGKSFFFRINGVDVFCGGSCWIPADNFLPRINAERYRNWIKLMVAGNQVMVR